MPNVYIEIANAFEVTIEGNTYNVAFAGDMVFDTVTDFNSHAGRDVPTDAFEYDDFMNDGVFATCGGDTIEDGDAGHEALCLAFAKWADECSDYLSDIANER